jgi:tRNA 2-thiouridine synthesizing protein A
MKKDYDKFVNAKGLKCPQPLLLLKLAIKEVDTGEVVLLEATDPHTDLDIEVWSQRFNHKIINTQYCEENYRFLIKK